MERRDCGARGDVSSRTRHSSKVGLIHETSTIFLCFFAMGMVMEYDCGVRIVSQNRILYLHRDMVKHVRRKAMIYPKISFTSSPCLAVGVLPVLQTHSTVNAWWLVVGV